MSLKAFKCVVQCHNWNLVRIKKMVVSEGNNC